VMPLVASGFDGFGGGMPRAAGQALGLDLTGPMLTPNALLGEVLGTQNGLLQFQQGVNTFRALQDPWTTGSRNAAAGWLRGT
jgi:hypothetical protein